MSRAVYFIAAAMARASAGHALAQSVTYRCVDSGGRSTYTNVKEEMSGKKCTVVSREVSVVPAQRPPPSAAPAPGAKVDGGTQKSRDETRRKILQEELDSAQKRLTEARQKLNEQTSVPGGGNRAADRLKPYLDEIDRQEQNIVSLRRELGNLR